jgi:hypothetical protein
VRNHDQKTKDMIESILPSTARDWARVTRRIIHKRERALARSELRRALCFVDPADPSAIDHHDGHVTFVDRRAIRAMVSDRRWADKASSLERWATRRIERDADLRDLDLSSQLDAFASLVPNNTIGRHALDHIKFALKPPRIWSSHGGARSQEVTVENLHAAVETIVRAGAAGELNRRMKYEHRRKLHRPDATALPDASGSEHLRLPRLLAGQHDIDAFAANTLGRPESALALDLADELRR